MKLRQIILKTLKWKILAQVILSLVATFSFAMIPACNKYLVDHVIQGGSRELLSLVAVYILSFCVFLLATWGSERFVWKCAISFENTLKKMCFGSIFSKSYSEFSKQKSDEYLSLLTNNITSVEQDYLQPACALVKSVCSVIVYAAVISINTSPLICVFLVILSIASAFTPKLYQKQLRKAGKEYVDEAAVYTKKVSDLLDGFDMVDDNSRAAYSRVNETFTDFLSRKRLNLGKKKVNGNTISGAAVCAIDILTFVLCGVLFIDGNITAGTVFAAITYAQSFTDPIQEILYDLNALNASKDIVSSLETMLSAATAPAARGAAPRRSIALEDLSVVYPDKTLNYNANFAAGKKYIITGESGSGKTTLLNALMQRCDSSGNILIDGKPGHLDTNAVFYLSQNQHVFSESFRDNVTIFSTYKLPPEERLRELPLIDNISDAQDCSALSGGEQQLLKFCRILAQEKDFLLLDEPFSAVDATNRRQLFHVLSECPSTIILVVHDLTFAEGDLSKWNVIRIEDVCDVIDVDECVNTQSEIQN